MEEIPILGVVVGKGQVKIEQEKGSKRMENTDKDQGRRKFPQICQFLPMVHSQLQSYRKTIK